ncbi:RagB/SusD family nutrient uptake outer membrane protein [Agriterribacter sp.]|uniref:RagB/SusD family nutrient uptake outer membrane protein n=1 Tax=Agriterribacter sp. TaxID=2821509 RepID=UPI002BA7B2E5|nr:RagB/SusD family nutrient uptake outer membrane protein [Agriterribacter sp.]HRP58529.1 RagB/SusD family nutrient uptake outer membrane protein [Agriterribacter sp.]
MKHTYFKAFIFLALFAAGCSKGLDLTPKDSISDITFWKSGDDFKLAVTNLYNSLGGFSVADLDLDSDIAFDVPNSVSNGTYLAPEKDSRWTDAYVYIRRSNKIIEKAAELASADTEVNRFVGEAKFFRAYNYWKLFRLFGGVPLITSVLDIEDEKLYTPRATREEIAGFIIKDLSEAATDLPLRSALPGADFGRITKGAANALKARVALFEGSWEKSRGSANADAYLNIAVEAAQSVMNSAEYSLFTAMGSQSYRYLFIDEGDGSFEGILDRLYQVKTHTQGIAPNVSDGHLLPTKKLADMYLCTDGLPISKSSLFQGYDQMQSEFEDRDPRMSMTMLIPGTLAPRFWYPDPVEAWPFYPQRNVNTGYITYKYLSENEGSNGSPDNIGYGFSRHIIRYGEVLLIYAEAIFEKNGSISDDDLNKSINLLRQRAGMPALTNSFVSTNNLDMRNEIRRERTIELALEGFRYDDLRRWKTAETELPKAVMGIKIIGTPWVNPIVVEGEDRNPYKDEYWKNRTDANGFIVTEKASDRTFNPDKHYLMPIPTKEVLINPELAQNPGW